MATSGWKLYTSPNNTRAFKSLIVAEYGGFQLETTPDFVFGKDNKSKEYLAKFPLGKVPALETPEGTVTESNAIARLVARKVASKHNLLGATDIERAQVNQWIDFSVSELELPLAAWIYPIMGIIPVHKEATEQAKVDIKKNLTILQNHLNTRTFLVGERISLADIVVAMTLVGGFKHVLDPGFRKPFGNVVRWYTTVLNQPQVIKVVGSFELCQKMKVADGKAAPQQQTQQPQQQQQKAAPAAKKEEPKKEAPAAEKKDEVDDLFGESAEGDAAEEPKKEEAKPKPPKKRVVEKSNVILDCKPQELETDMALMEEKVRAIVMDGLFWGPSKLVEVAYGIKKLQITCVIEDEKVMMDDLEEKVTEACGDLLQSIDVASMVRAG